jgi:hypothetical protein
MAVSERVRYFRDLSIQILGTVIGGNLVFLCLKAAGFFGDVNWDGIWHVTAIVLIVAGGLITLIVLQLGQQKLNRHLLKMAKRRVEENPNISDEDRARIDKALEVLIRALPPFL